MKFHLEPDNIFGFIEFGESVVAGDQSIDSIAKAYEDPNGLVGVSVACLSVLCNPFFERANPLPLSPASLLLFD